MRSRLHDGRPRAPDGAACDGRPLRVLMVTPRYLPDVGGVERHVSEVSRRLVESGHEVSVVCTDRTGRRPAVEEFDGVNVRRVRAWPRRRDYYFAPGVWGEISRRPCDVIHVQSYHTLIAPLAMLAALRVRVPYVVTFHGGGHSSRLRTKLRPAQRRFLRPLLARAARLVAVAPFEIELYGRELEIPAGHFSLIPNGADVEPHVPSVPIEDDADGPLIASVGRLERYKGHHRVLAAFPYVLAARPDARLWIAGSGPYEEPLRREARRLGIGESVEIKAAPTSESLAARLSRADLVVLLSEFETHPLAALEAVSLGRRLLVAHTTGLAELAEQGLARAVAAHSEPAAIAEAILEELEHPPDRAELRLPTWDECASGLLALYCEVTGRT